MSTPFLDKVYHRVDFDRELVNKFFTVFSLFEYALKQTGFLIGNPGDDARPDWVSFARSIDKNFDKNAYPNLGIAVNYMLTRPVKKQIRLEDNLEFRSRKRPSGMSDSEWLSVLIRGVRNNLFHGGKFCYDRPRNPELIQYSLAILENWTQLHPAVSQALEEIR